VTLYSCNCETKRKDNGNFGKYVVQMNQSMIRKSRAFFKEGGIKNGKRVTYLKEVDNYLDS